MSWCIFAEVHGWLTWLVNTWQHYCFFKRMWFEVCDPKIVFLPEQDTTTTAQGYIQNVYTAMNALLLSGTQWDWAYWTKAKKDGFDGINCQSLTRTSTSAVITRSGPMYRYAATPFETTNGLQDCAACNAILMT